jgi:AbrB family looped-hinge helix DNA binding protein
MSKVTAKYQITLPKEIRKAMNIMPGTTVGFEQKAGRFYLVKNNNINPIDKWRGSLKLEKKTDEIMADLRGYGIESFD